MAAVRRSHPPPNPSAAGSRGADGRQPEPSAARCLSSSPTRVRFGELVPKNFSSRTQLQKCRLPAGWCRTWLSTVMASAWAWLIIPSMRGAFGAAGWHRVGPATAPYPRTSSFLFLLSYQPACVSAMNASISGYHQGQDSS